MTNKFETRKSIFGLTKGRRKKLWFYLAFIAFPVIHYLVFYVYINFNSFILAFRNYYIDDSTKMLTFGAAGLINFAEAWQVLVANSKVIGNSLLMLAVQLFAITLYRKLKYTLWYQKACGSWLVHLERGPPSTPFLQ